MVYLFCFKKLQFGKWISFFILFSVIKVVNVQQKKSHFKVKKIKSKRKRDHFTIQKRKSTL